MHWISTGQSVLAQAIGRTQFAGGDPENTITTTARRMCRFANGLARHGNARQLMLLIGEVKEIVPTHLHFKAVIKHVPDQAFCSTVSCIGA